MRFSGLAVVGVGALLLTSAHASPNPFVGRWDITVTTDTATYPSWMEVVDKSGTLLVRVQPRSGSVRPIAKVKMEDQRLVVTISEAAANRPGIAWTLSADGGRLTGTQKRGDAVAGKLEGVRAPELKHAAPSSWSKPESLFNGKDLTGWEPDNPAANHWIARDGTLLNETKGANLRTTRKFDDFKLHVEFNCPEGGNSGLYLRGRYEVQLEYEPPGREDKYHSMGAVYGMTPVEIETPRKPGEWESFDITLIGRFVTVVRSGVTIIDNKEIAGITGGALDSHEADPGPFYIQGDHTGGIRFRNVSISVPK